MIKFNLIVSLLILPIMATDIAAQARFTPKELPYAYDALAPQVSEETLRFHHDKHYVGYVNKLNELILDTPYAQQPLEDIVVSADGAIFNNAAQMWNHEFFFDQLSPDGEARPTGALLKAIDADFGSFEQFKAQMEKAAVGLFGSGWAWLAEDKSGKLAIVTEQNAGNPMCHGMKPLMCFDVWEHAYYIDYRNPSRRRRRRPLGSHRLEGRRRPLRKEIRVCFCWKCRLRFSGRHFLLCCRQTFRARPFAVAGAEYTGRGSLLSAGPVSGVLPESGYGCFCTQNSSLCTFFRPWIPFSARKSVSSQHENSKVEMLERIQYALFILLFVLAGSLDGAQVQSGRVVSQPDRICQSTPPDAGSGTQLFHGGSLHLRRSDRKSRPTVRPEGDRPSAP